MKEKLAVAFGGRTKWALILIAVIMVSIPTPATTFVMLGVIALGSLLEVWTLGVKKRIGQDKILFMSLFVMVALTCFMVLRVLFGFAFAFQFIWMIWVFDTFALFGGSICGLLWETHKIWPAASPKKSWEGAVVGLTAALASVFLTEALLSAFGFAPALALGSIWPQLVIILCFGHLGDFLESYFKRWKVDIKDSGEVFGGHGGFLDRFDAFMFASVAAVLLVLVGLL